MKAITYSDARRKLTTVMDRVCEDHNPTIITRGKKSPVVMLSLEDYEAWEETIHLSKIPGMVESIKSGMNEKIEDCSDEIEW